jgi:hypothetical protein
MPPSAADRTLRSHVGRLRRLLGTQAGRVVARAPGYLIRVEPAELHLLEFERCARRRERHCRTRRGNRPGCRCSWPSTEAVANLDGVEALVCPSCWHGTAQSGRAAEPDDLETSACFVNGRSCARNRRSGRFRKVERAEGAVRKPLPALRRETPARCRPASRAVRPTWVISLPPQDCRESPPSPATVRAQSPTTPQPQRTTSRTARLSGNPLTRGKRQTVPPTLPNHPIGRKTARRDNAQRA